MENTTTNKTFVFNTFVYYFIVPHMLCLITIIVRVKANLRINKRKYLWLLLVGGRVKLRMSK